jgi:uncharacterized RDD family membrane protein YckC
MVLAGIPSRFVAWLIDVGVIMAASSLIRSGAGILVGLSADAGQALAILSFFVVSMGYRIVLEWHWRGQTVGKRVVGLRVLDSQGLNLRFGQIVIRNLLRAVDALPLAYLVGAIGMLGTRHCQRLGDVMANTVVVRTRRPPAPDLTQTRPTKYNSFRKYPHLVARLRQKVTPIEADLALTALLRRDSLDDTARVALFDDLARHFAAIVTFPPEITDGISDEQAVRNVVDVLFSAR